MSKPKAFNNDICCCGGGYVPEGCQVCHECEKKTENRFKVSETLMIGVDIGQGDDISVLQVVRVNGNNREVINTMYGEEAEWTYNHLKEPKSGVPQVKMEAPDHNGLSAGVVICDEFVPKEKEENHEIGTY